MLIMAGFRQLLFEYFKLKYRDNDGQIQITNIDLQFQRFGELDCPVSISILQEDENLKVEVIQNDQTITHGIIKFLKR